MSGKNLPADLYAQLDKHFSEDDKQKPPGIPYGEQYTYNALAYVQDVEDGDTWRGVRKPDPFITFKSEYYRLDDVDTHETDGKHAEKAKKEKKFTEDFVKKGEQNWDSEWPFVIVFSDLTDSKKDYSGPEAEGTYGRPIADLIRRSDGASLKQSLLDEFGDSIRPSGE